MELSKEWADEEVTLGYENVNHTLEKLENFIKHYFYVVTLTDEVVGYSFGMVNNGSAGPAIPVDENYLEIYEVYIHSEHRGEKLGTKLVKELMAKAEEHDVKRVLVGSSNRKWLETAKFYEGMGFNMWYFQMYK